MTEPIHLMSLWVINDVKVGEVDIEVEADTTAPTVTSSESFDTNSDGNVDTVVFEFFEAVDDNEIDVSDFTFSTDGFSNSDSGDSSIVTDVSSYDGYDQTAADDKYIAVTFTPSNVSGTGVVEYKYFANAGVVADLAGNEMEDIIDPRDADYGAAPVIMKAETDQSFADATLNIGESDGTVTVDAINGENNKLNGAFGNNIEVKVVNDSDNDNTTASYTNQILTVELADDGSSITATVSEVASVISNVDGFETSSSNGSEKVDSTIESSLSNGSDSVDISFSEDIDNDTLDTSDVNTDFDFNNAENVTGTTTESNYGSLSITITQSDAQILGDEIYIKSGAIEDLNGNEADTSPVTIEQPQVF